MCGILTTAVLLCGCYLTPSYVVIIAPSLADEMGWIDTLISREELLDVNLPNFPCASQLMRQKKKKKMKEFLPKSRK